MDVKSTRDWSWIDDLIKKYLQLVCVSDFVDKYCDKLAKKSYMVKLVSKRAKMLGIKPAVYKPSAGHRKKTSVGMTKYALTDDISDYLRLNYMSKPRIDMARELGITRYAVNKFMSELNLTTPAEVTAEACTLRSLAHIGKATEVSSKRWKDDEFRTRARSEMSERSKALWADEKYRFKVRSGIRKAYKDGSVQSRLSAAGKLRYAADASVREILHAPREFWRSKLNDDVATVLDAYNIQYEREFDKIPKYHFDFKIGRILLEVNGDYWHSLPNNQRNDRAKRTVVERYYPEYNVVTLWESQFRSIRGKQILLDKIGYEIISPTMISLDQLVFGEFDDKSVEDRFLDGFHYLGRTKRRRHSFALTYNGELVALAVFGQLIRQNISKGNAIELTRLCRYPFLYNRNMLSYLLSKSTKELTGTYDMVISYADSRLHTGAIYKACNWVDAGLTQSDYNYLSNDLIPMHKKTLYNRARNAGMTENEYATVYNYKKTKIGSKRKFIKYLSKD